MVDCATSTIIILVLAQILIQLFPVQLEGRRDTVLVLKDSGGHTFGAFIPFLWQNKHDYYGTGANYDCPTLKAFVCH